MNISALTWNPHPVLLGGEQAIANFANGYSASILRGGAPSLYTKNGTYELAVLRDGNLCYDTPITSDVLGYLTKTEVEEILVQIEQL